MGDVMSFKWYVPWYGDRKDQRW